MSNYDNRVCVVDDCFASVYAKGLCEKHYARVRRHGDPHRNAREDRRDPKKHLLSSYKPNGNGCWMWQGTVGPSGYGAMKVGRKRHLAHRLSYELLKADIPDGQCVLHKCDTPLCINPDHLFLGSRADNNADKVRKGRECRGEDSPFAKLTESAVRHARNSNESITALAEKFGVSHETMRKAINKETWRQV